MLEKRQLRALTGSLGAGDGAGAGCGTAGFGIGITEVARVYNLATYLPEMRNLSLLPSHDDGCLHYSSFKSMKSRRKF